MNLGGTFIGATTIFSSGIGPVAENDFPYKNEEDVAIALNNGGGSNGLWEVPEEYIEEIEEKVEKEDAYLYSYATRNSDKDSDEGIGWYDWSIDESDRFRTLFEFAESNLLPSPAGTDENGKYKYNEQGTLAIKDELMRGRGVSVMFYGQSGIGLEGEAADYINIPAYAQYSYSEDGSKLTPNHGVCIVGWDDNYSKSNFIEGHQPPADGAWIVKNSYGAKDNEFPNKYNWGVDDTGYFYLSYYDMGIENPETFDFDIEENFEPGDAGYFIVDQYDLMPLRTLMSTKSEDRIKMANVFGAEQDEVLRSVSVETVNPDTDVTIEIYLLNENAEGPEDGELLETLDKTYKYGGYHRTNLEKGLYIPEGKSYSIVATLYAGGKYELLTPVSVSKEMAEEANLNFYGIGVINENESFLFTESEGWKDWAYKSGEILAGNDEYKGTVTDNFGLKGYSDPATTLEIDLDTVNDKDTYTAGDEITFTLNIKNLKKYDIHNVVVESSLTDLAESGNNLIEELPAGETKNIAYTYSLTDKDISNGLVNENITVNLPNDKNFEPALCGMVLYLDGSGSNDREDWMSTDISGFTDVVKDAYYTDAVKWAIFKGITTGTGEDTFSPEDSCTRVQMVTFLWRAAGSPEPESMENPFTDIDTDMYYGKAVLWAIEQDITQGTGENTFSPDDTVTREQAITFVFRAGGQMGARADLSFTDVDSNAYYADAVSWAVANDITKGVSDTEFGTDRDCTRAQIVTLLYRWREPMAQ